ARCPGACLFPYTTLFRSAAGHGLRELGPPLGLDVPIRPQRGHILVTERTQPFLPVPMSSFRQTAEGSVMLGVSAEEVGYDDSIRSEEHTSELQSRENLVC